MTQDQAENTVTSATPSATTTKGVDRTTMAASTTTWHADTNADVDSRRIVIHQIVQLLEQCKPEAFAERKDKLIDLARRLEVALYKASNSKAEYMDTSTLRQRVRDLAKASGAAQSRQPSVSQPQSNSSSKDGENRPPSSQELQQMRQQQATASTNSNNTAAANHRGNAPGNSNARVPVGVGAVPTKPGQSASTTPLSGSNGVTGTLSGGAGGSQNGGGQAQVLQHERQRAQILKQRQQRLLLLRHASKCPAKEGECTMTSYCAPMKTLWVHIAKCKNQRCQVPHCVSSRYVLSHYHRCQDANCPVCKPVRSLQPMRNKRPREMSQEEIVQMKRMRLQQQQLQQQQQLALQTKSLDPAAAAVEKQRLARAQQIQRQQYMMRMQQQQQQQLKQQQTNGQSNAQRQYTPQQMQMLQMRRSQSQVKYVIDPKFARSCKSGTGPSLPYSMTPTAIAAHLRFLKVERLQSSFTPFLRRLMEHKHNRGIFNEPVDPVGLNIPEYTKLIKKPMDLGTIRRQLDQGFYPTLKKFQADLRLVFTNAITFNPPGHGVHDMANLLLKVVDQDVPKIEQKMDKETRNKKDKKCQLCFQLECEICPLCERGCVPYEPKMLYCAGACAGRIARNGQFYTAPGSSYSWCQDCFDKCKAEALVVNGTSYPKRTMIKKKNNDLFAEPWVNCDRCERWCHQVCALFNPRKNDSKNPKPYVCPICLLADAEKAKEEEKGGATTKATTSAAKKKTPTKTSAKKSSTTSSPKTDAHALIRVPAEKPAPGALDLPHTRLGQFVERWVREKLASARKAQEERPDYSTSWNVGPPAEHLYIRVVDNHDDFCKVKPYVKTVQGYPSVLPFRSRNISLFQKLDGVDVLIFALYVQEYGSDCPEPNSRKIYIAYLDSVHYFRPRQLRTMVYQELLIAYLEYSRRRGFTSAYIWACPPPNKRDDYILHCHPEDQRVPSADRLRKWYHGLIRRGAARREFVGSCALFEEHFVDNKTTRSKKNTKKKKGSKKTKSKKQKGKSKKGGKKGGIAKGSGSSGLPLAKQVSLVEGVVGALNDEEDEEGMSNFLENLPNMEGEDEDRAGNESPIAGNLNQPNENENVDGENGMTLPGVCPATGQKFLTPENGIKTGDDRMLPDDLERRKSNKLALRGHIPYFEGDYWPQEAEELAKEIMNKAKKEAEKKVKQKPEESSGRGGRKRRRNGEEAESETVPATAGSTESTTDKKDGDSSIKKEPNMAPASEKKPNNKSTTQKSGTPKPKSHAEAQAMAKAAARAKEEAIAAEIRKMVSKEALIDKKLAEQLAAMKDDFLVVKMAHECTRCGKYLLRGRWECRHPDCTGCAFNQSPPFALCNSCYELECERPVECQHGGGCVAPGEAGKPLDSSLNKRMEDGKDQTRLLMENSFHHRLISLDEDQKRDLMAQQAHLKESAARVKAGLPIKPYTKPKPGATHVKMEKSEPAIEASVSTAKQQENESSPGNSVPSHPVKAEEGVKSADSKVDSSVTKPATDKVVETSNNAPVGAAAAGSTTAAASDSPNKNLTGAPPSIVAPKHGSVDSDNVTTPSPKEERPAPTAEVKELPTASSQILRNKLEGSSGEPTAKQLPLGKSMPGAKPGLTDAATTGPQQTAPSTTGPASAATSSATNGPASAAATSSSSITGPASATATSSTTNNGPASSTTGPASVTASDRNVKSGVSAQAADVKMTDVSQSAAASNGHNHTATTGGGSTTNGDASNTETTQTGSNTTDSKTSTSDSAVKQQSSTSSQKPVGNQALPKIQFPIPIVKKSRQEQEKEWATMPLGCSRKTGKPTDNHVLHFVDENMPIKTPFHDTLNRNQLLESRHAFLSLCTGNRYQFDQLRRAKFSTMMVLYHLHNPEAPAHLYTCTKCQKDILVGKRYHCDVCNGGDYDLCQNCVVSGAHQGQPHKLNAIEIIKGVELESTETQRSTRRKLDQQRARSLQIFLDALVHASSCRESVCTVEGCHKMRDLLSHRERCHVRVRGGCEICKRVMCLVQMHVRKCPLKRCPVPHCDDVKRLLAEQLKLQAQRRSVQAAALAQGGAAGRGRKVTGTVKNKATAGRGGTMKATVVAGSGGTKIKIKTSGTTIKPPGSSPDKPPKAKKPKLSKK